MQIYGLAFQYRPIPRYIYHNLCHVLVQATSSIDVPRWCRHYPKSLHGFYRLSSRASVSKLSPFSRHTSWLWGTYYQTTRKLSRLNYVCCSITPIFVNFSFFPDAWSYFIHSRQQEKTTFSSKSKKQPRWIVYVLPELRKLKKHENWPLSRLFWCPKWIFGWVST